MGIKSWLKNIWVGVVKNWCGSSGQGILKFVLYQEWTDVLS